MQKDYGSRQLRVARGRSAGRDRFVAEAVVPPMTPLVIAYGAEE
jgi:hypothetical protein